MASTESRSGFRLPWSSDKSVPQPAGSQASADAPSMADVGYPRLQEVTMDAPQPLAALNPDPEPALEVAEATAMTEPMFEAAVAADPDPGDTTAVARWYH